jgi:cobalt-zinc-cadmium efflux system protein
MSKLAKQKLKFAVIFTSSIFLIEVIGGFWTHSLALLSDAAHVLMDLFSLGLSLIALILSSRPASGKRTYGWHRAEVFAALFNGTSLFLVSLWIMYETVMRLKVPHEIKSIEMIVIAVFGLVGNLIVLFALKEHSHRDVNMRSAFLHVLGDFLSSIGVVVAGVIIYFTHWLYTDHIVAFIIGISIMFGSVRVLKESSHILFEGVPKWLDFNKVADAIKGVPGVQDIHHLHIWCICSNLISLSSHALIDSKDRKRSDEIIREINKVLREKFCITDTTIQLDELVTPEDTLIPGVSHPPEEHEEHEEH